MKHQRARQDLIRFCRLAHEQGLMTATDGNISLRLPGGGILITPSGRSKALVQPEELVELDSGGNPLPGGGTPSQESALHLAVYRRRPEAGAVVHAHPPHVTAFSISGREPEFAALPEVLLGLGRVALVPYATPCSPELAAVAEPYLEDHQAMILAHHGSLTLGPDLESAWARTEKLEAAARTLWAAQALGGARPLPPAEQERLLHLGGHLGKTGRSRPLAQRVERVRLARTTEFAVEKIHQDQRGTAHLVSDGRPLARVCLLTLGPDRGHRGGHLHRHKHEGFYVVQGRARVELVDAESGERLVWELEPGERLWIPPGVAHRIQALEELVFVEFCDRAYDPADDLPFQFDPPAGGE